MTGATQQGPGRADLPGPGLVLRPALELAAIAPVAVLAFGGRGW